MLKLDLLQSVIAGVGLPKPRALGFVPPLVTHSPKPPDHSSAPSWGLQFNPPSHRCVLDTKTGEGGGLILIKFNGSLWIRFLQTFFHPRSAENVVPPSCQEENESLPRAWKARGELEAALWNTHAAELLFSFYASIK